MVALCGPPGKFVNRAVSSPPGLEQQSSMLPPGLELSSRRVIHADVAAFSLRNAQLKEEVAVLQPLEGPALYAPWGAGRAWATTSDEPAWPTCSDSLALPTATSRESTNCGSSDCSEEVVVVEGDGTTVKKVVKEVVTSRSSDWLEEGLSWSCWRKKWLEEEVVKEVVKSRSSDVVDVAAANLAGPPGTWGPETAQMYHARPSDVPAAVMDMAQPVVPMDLLAALEVRKAARSGTVEDLAAASIRAIKKFSKLERRSRRATAQTKRE